MDVRPHLASRRVKFYTRSISKRLYLESSHFYEDAGYPCVRLVDKSADGYFYTMLADEECDVAINVDEDAFVSDIDAVLDLAEYAIANGYANTGVPDCSPACPRGANPLVTNPFFNIFDLQQIRTKWQGKETEREILKLRYDDVRGELARNCHYEDPVVSGDLENIDLEPYYNFFFWLDLNFKTLFLKAYIHVDGFSTVVVSPDGRTLCKHSWMSRFYGQDSRQTRRIDALIDEVASERGVARLEFSNRQKFAMFLDLALRFVIRVPQRVAAWPRKWRKWYDRWQRKRKLRATT